MYKKKGRSHNISIVSNGHDQERLIPDMTDYVVRHNNKQSQNCSERNNIHVYI